MKNYRFLLLFSLFCGLLIFTQCTPEEEFDESLLIGTWKKNSNPSEKWRYDANHRGATWNVIEDILEEEAHTLSWSLDKSKLTHSIDFEINEGKLPKVYTVTTLTSTVLEYKDDFGTTITLSRN